jgi:hypothetical protein
MAGHYAITPIVVIDFIDVKDIAIELPFLDVRGFQAIALIFKYLPNLSWNIM